MELTKSKVIAPEGYKEFYNAENHETINNQTSMELLANLEEHTVAAYRLQNYNSFEPYRWPKEPVDQCHYYSAFLSLVYDDKTCEHVSPQFVGWSWELLVMCPHRLSRRGPVHQLVSNFLPKYTWRKRYHTLLDHEAFIDQRWAYLDVNYDNTDNTLTGSPWCLVAPNCAMIVELTKPEGVLIPFECHDARIVSAWSASV